jgi:hypothetical protein
MLAILTIISKVKTAFTRTHPFVPANTAKSLAAVASVEVLVIGVIVIALWLWLASASKRGHGWVKTAGTVLFGLATYLELVMVRIPGLGGANGIGVVIWLIGLVTVILLWQRSSREFFSIQR